MVNGSKEKIVVLGGGIASLVTIFELTSVPNWQDHYEIELYQLGWRLGGKGASGRNRKYDDRIEEHGLHVWFGFYENAFQIMLRCYDELKRSPDDPLPNVDAAFTGIDNFSFMENINDEWKSWNIIFPTNTNKPGMASVDDEITMMPSMLTYLELMIDWLTDFSHKGLDFHWLSSVPSKRPPWWSRLEKRVGAEIKDFAYQGEAIILEYVLHLLKIMARGVNKNRVKEALWLRWLVKTFQGWMRDQVEKVQTADDGTRRFWLLLDLGITCVIGLIASDVLKKGLDTLDDAEFTDWLIRYGASKHAVYSTLTQSLYDVAFAFKDGNIKTRNMAAGVAIRVILRVLLTYKGHILYKMNAGMGDAVFTPLYEVLKQRGVKFKFFHKILNIGLSQDGTVVETIRIQRQVDLCGNEYHPLVMVKDLACWPSEPLYEQLIQGNELETRCINLESRWTEWQGVGDFDLVMGQDFDRVVLGISLAALNDVAPDFYQKHERWKAMMDNMKTVQTQAIQLWFNTDKTTEMKWNDDSSIISSYVEPWSSWSDFSQLIEREDAPKDTVQTIAYCCGVLPDSFGTQFPPPSDHQFPKQEVQRVRENALAYLRKENKAVWSGISQTDGALDWNALVAPDNVEGEARIDAQYLRANVDPTERYVLSVAGSTRYRLEPDGTGIQNLIITGTWINTGLNLSCIEAGAIAGMKASRAICGYPKRIFGEKDII